MSYHYHLTPSFQNTTEIYGSLQGIAGSGALGHIEALELPEDFEKNE